jgi:OOP family OmpA-OmpF porin
MIKKTLLCSMMVLGLLGISQNGQCAPKAGEFFISPMIGGHVFEGNQDPFHADEELDHGLTVGLGLGYQMTKALGLELVVNVTDTEADPYDVDVDVYPARLDLFYNLTQDSAFVPYVAAGLGAVTFSADDVDNDTDFMVNYGLGVKYYMTESIALRADVRHLISYHETQSNFLYTIGLVFGFGGEKEAAPVQAKEETKPVEAVAVVAETDSDGDGVLDSADRCANTPSGVKVDSKGCPVDSDNDGVTDDKDKCPNTAAGTEVDDNGCAVAKKVELKDSDKDGVYDDKDKCANTPEGANVNANGCWIIKDLRFDLGKTTILASSKPNVDEVVVVLQKNPEMKLEIQGYTDNSGSAKFNQKLSEKRAIAVMEYIKSKGIAKDRITAKGYGIENPAETNDTEEGRALNRRVELKPVF